MRTLCAIKGCRNQAPGRTVVPQKRSRRGKAVVLNICSSCIAKIRERHGIK